MRIVNEIIIVLELIALIVCLTIICHLFGNIKPGRSQNKLLKKTNQILATERGHKLPLFTGIKTNPGFSLAKHKIGVEDGLVGDRANLKGKTPQRIDCSKIPQTMIASYYDLASLKKEGTYKTSKGVMANGKVFDENAYTCACRMYPLGAVLRITNTHSGKWVVVTVTDRIGKRFAETRIDLSRAAMEALGGQWALDQGLVKVIMERIK